MAQIEASQGGFAFVCACLYIGMLSVSPVPSVSVSLSSTDLPIVFM